MARTTNNSRKTANNGKRPDFVEFGSERHAALLRLRKATKDDDQELVIGGYTLANIAEYGPNATTRFLKTILMQRINELNSTPEIPQSEDRSKPNYAPPMFDPDELANEQVSQSELQQAFETLKRAGLVN